MFGRKGLIITAGVLLIALTGTGCAPPRSFDARLKSIVRPYIFSIPKWEARTIFGEAKQSLPEKRASDGVSRVAEYFSAVEKVRALKSEVEKARADGEQEELASLEEEIDEWRQEKAALEGTVEKIIGRQIRETLSRQGIYNPVDRYLKLKIGFPPLNFKLEKPPHLLVVSPREKIESMREVTLLQDMRLEEIEGIEAEVDKLGVSSLVVGLGGFGGTYPALVTDEASLRFVIDTAAEEWLHQYLTFTPLGFLYLLDLTGVARNYEIATMTETLASMVSKEIGSMVYEKCYLELEGSGNGALPPEAKPDPEFNREMRAIRSKVDEYLARGEVKQAEEFMERKRQYLVSKGYDIRKLNQAYFAFYGTYADRPSSISPIGNELRELRNQSASLKDFLGTVAMMTDRQDLMTVLNE